MAGWSLDDIPWHLFDASKVDPELLSLAKSACMVEHNGRDYARYLREAFAGTPELHEIVEDWAEEEVQHGMVLRKWAEMADPNFDFEKSFKEFTTGYQLPKDVNASVRGSYTGELVARCVVETGTSNYYTAIKEYTEEPVLKAICARIAADEFRHYKLFYDILNEYQPKEKISAWKRLCIALGRVAESEDDELAYAFYSAHVGSERPAYDRQLYARRYLACVGKIYRKHHIEKMVSMVFKAAGFRPYPLVHRLFSVLAWNVMQRRARLS